MGGRIGAVRHARAADGPTEHEAPATGASS